MPPMDTIHEPSPPLLPTDSAEDPDGHSSDVGFDAESAVHDRAVVAVFQRHAGSNLSHRHGPLILTPLGVLGPVF